MLSGLRKIDGFFFEEEKFTPLSSRPFPEIRSEIIFRWCRSITELINIQKPLVLKSVLNIMIYRKISPSSGEFCRPSILLNLYVNER